jgi:hypothetical protein
MKGRLEGVQNLRFLGIDESRSDDDVVGRAGCAVASPNGGGASVGDVNESRRGNDGGGQGACGVLSPKAGDTDIREVDEYSSKLGRWRPGGGCFFCGRGRRESRRGQLRRPGP